MAYHLKIRTLAALIDSRDWADACARYPHTFHGWSMQQFYDERGEALAVAQGGEAELARADAAHAASLDAQARFWESLGDNAAEYESWLDHQEAR